MLKKLFWILIVTNFCIAAKTDFEFTQKNSIRLHPLNLISLSMLEFEEYTFEVDYTHQLNKKVELVSRFSIFNIDPSFIDFDATGEHKEWEIEVGARFKKQVYTGSISRIHVFPQTTIAGGDVTYYYHNYEDNETISYSGKMAKLYLTGGIQFDIKRIIFGLDLGLGIGLYVPDVRERITSEPNFTVGFSF